MTLKIVLAVATGRDNDTATLDVALSVARRFGAHIDALHIKGDPRDAIPFLGEGASGVLIEQIMTAAERDAGTRSGKARAAFESWQAASGLSLVSRPGEGGGSAGTVAWREEIGAEEECMARRGRLSDLIALGRPPADDSGASTVLFETALFDTGRPVLVAPPSAPATSTVDTPVVIFWTGSAEAARAIGGAMPLLGASRKVLIIAANVAGKVAETGGLVEYLQWHGVRAEAKDPLDITPAAGGELLASAKREGAGLLVMGAYTQSRLRQLIYGSVTKHVLTSAELPVLMAH
jgi:nucleotide-binding universal stress UspA family protein